MRIRQSFKRHESLTEIFSYFTSSRLSILLIGWLSSLVILKSKWYFNPQSIIDLFFRWDSGWYLSIVQNGYFYSLTKESSVVFFPLYPLLVKTFSYVFVDVRLAGIVLSNVALLLAMIYLSKLVKLDYEDKISSNAVIFALIFPASFFFSIFYSESLFLFLSVACFYYARKDRWFLSSLFGYFAALTRALGVFVFIPILIEYFHRVSLRDFRLNKIKRDILYLLLIPAGLVTYMVFLYANFNDPLAFLKAEGAWSRGFSLSLSFLTNVFIYDLFYVVIFLGFAAFLTLVLVYLIYSKIRISYIVYTLVQLLLVFSSSSLESLPRYVSVLFPIYVGFALVARNRVWDQTLKLFFTSFLVLFVILFVNGYWLT